ALAGMDGINALAEGHIKSARLKTTKPPHAYAGAPHIVNEKIDLQDITKSTTVFSGNAKEAAAAFPANINVAATLCLATRLPPESMQVEICADPGAAANRHEVTVEGEFSTLRFSVENKPNPANPKSSALAGMSIVSLLRRQAGFFTVG
ncbi:MAG: DUF108 domain-containing protein, partial [Proteobacteria bacterium]|nr:DUF108 domain-containing protein [Pseudomonadota bacterium]